MDTNVKARAAANVHRREIAKACGKSGVFAGLGWQSASLPEIAWKAIFLNRISFIANADLAHVYVNAHQFDDAIAQGRKTVIGLFPACYRKIRRYKQLASLLPVRGGRARIQSIYAAAHFHTHRPDARRISNGRWNFRLVFWCR
jgi:hypothetical protein